MNDAPDTEYQRGLRAGFRSGVVAAAWTALLNGYFNAPGRKEEIYGELLEPGEYKDPPDDV